MAKKQGNQTAIPPPWGGEVKVTEHMRSRNKGPKKFKTEQEIYNLAEAYAKKCRKEFVPLTITGMALALGFNSRDAFYRFGAESRFFGSAIRRVRTIVEQGYEARLHSSSPSGAIFALKAMGWKEGPTQLEVSGPGGQPLQTVTREMSLKEAQEAYAASLAASKS